MTFHNRVEGTIRYNRGTQEENQTHDAQGYTQSSNTGTMEHRQSQAKIKRGEPRGSHSLMSRRADRQQTARARKNQAEGVQRTHPRGKHRLKLRAAQPPGITKLAETTSLIRGAKPTQNSTRRRSLKKTSGNGEQRQNKKDSGEQQEEARGCRTGRRKTTDMSVGKHGENKKTRRHQHVSRRSGNSI